MHTNHCYSKLLFTTAVSRLFTLIEEILQIMSCLWGLTSRLRGLTRCLGSTRLFLVYQRVAKARMEKTAGELSGACQTIGLD